MGSLTHPSGIRQEIVDKVVARRGRLHAYEQINPTKTALVVVDLDTATTRRMGSDTDILKIIQPINRIAAALRAREGVVAWVTTPIQKAPDNFRAIFGDEATAMYEAEGAPGGEGHTLWHELDTKPATYTLSKNAAVLSFRVTATCTNSCKNWALLPC